MIVVLFDPRRPSLVPVEAIEHLTGEVQYTEEMPVAVPWSLSRRAAGAHRRGRAGAAVVGPGPPRRHRPAWRRGARLISAPESPRGERLVDAVAMMDKLRTAGPWESEQTHDSLRRFLLEETYELLDAVRSGNADQLREELGDVLLQVLFHARIAEDARAVPLHHRRRRRHADAKARQSGAGSACGRTDFARRPAGAVGRTQGGGEIAEFGDGRCPYRSAGVSVGAEGDSTRQRCRAACRPDPRRDHRRSLCRPRSMPKACCAQRF